MTSAPDGLGTAAEEAARLFEAVQDWARRTGGGLGEHVATDSPECQVCPVCQLLRLLRGVQPETFEHLGDAAASLTAALRSAVQGLDQGGARRSSAPSERIDIG